MSNPQPPNEGDQQPGEALALRSENDQINSPRLVLFFAIVAPCIVAFVSYFIYRIPLLAVIAAFLVLIFVAMLMIFVGFRAFVGNLLGLGGRRALACWKIIWGHKVWSSAGLAGFVLVAVLLCTVVFPAPGPCGSLEEIGGECIGVTDGGDGAGIFGDELTEVVRAIGDENERVEAAGAGQYVTVAFMAPLTDRSVTADRISHELAGAFTAQYRANNLNTAGGGFPGIRLVLANQGRGELQWRRIVAELKEMKDEGPDHLVAVTGLGVSQRETLEAVRELAAEGIPMVGDVITADGFNMTGAIAGGGRIPGLYRMPFPVSRQFEVISRYLQDRRKDLRTALRVQDASIDTGNPDLYTNSLARAFEKGRFGAYWRAGGSKINVFGDVNTPPSVLKNEFSQISDNVCDVDPPDMIFYAGRAAYLPTFLTFLRGRGCSRPITVITGSDASSLPLRTDITKLLEDPDAHMSVLYVPLAHPSDLAGLRRYQEFEAAFTLPHSAKGDRFGIEELLDGWAIMAHDAVLTAAKGIRNAAADQDTLPEAAAVNRQIRLFTSSNNSVPGATGDFQIDSGTGDRKGGAPPEAHFVGRR